MDSKRSSIFGCQKKTLRNEFPYAQHWPKEIESTHFLQKHFEKMMVVKAWSSRLKGGSTRQNGQEGSVLQLVGLKRNNLL